MRQFQAVKDFSRFNSVSDPEGQIEYWIQNIECLFLRTVAEQHVFFNLLHTTQKPDSDESEDVTKN